jgi:hypothetical protein
MSAHLMALWEQVEDRGLYDVPDWRQALATIDEVAHAVAQFDSESAAELREVIGSLETEDGLGSLPPDIAVAVERLRAVISRLRALP